MTSKKRSTTPPSKPKYKQIIAIFVLILFFNLTVVQALEIRNVHAGDITDTQATILYETDEPANTIVYYGSDSGSLTSQGDAIPTLEHSLTLSNLIAQTAYLFKVQSGDIIDDNNAALYTFTTLPPDTTPPEITADIPSIIEGTALTFTGTTQPGSTISLSLNGNFIATKTIDTDTEIYKFENILLIQDKINTITLGSKDAAGNKAQIEKTVYADVATPKMIIIDFPEVVGERKFMLSINVSENATIRVMKSSSEIASIQGDHVQIPLTLDEGTNNFNVTASDQVNHSSTKEISIYADTQDPQISLDFERGNEYYEGRAVSDINGKTDPGADVFLYIFKPQIAQYQPDFSRAQAKTTADENGDFTFDDVTFEGRGITDIRLKDLKPRQLPSGLINDPIYPFQAGPEAEQKAFYVYVIAEDKGGRVGYAKDTVRINSCSSRSLDFSIDSLSQFQGPLRLVPQLMDDGRQEIQATFQLRYLGQNLVGVDNDETYNKGIKIDSIEFEPACTEATAKNDRFSLGCKLMPRNQPNKVYNNDRSVVYTTWRLLPAADLTKRDDDLWNDFKKRQLVFPLRVKVNYYEKEGEKAQSALKQQFFCYDLGYFVDIPIESKEMLPDFLAEEGIDSLNWTINQLQTARPYVEQAYLVSGVTCIGSFLLRTVIRGARLLTSKMETYYSVVKKGVKTSDAQDNVEYCPANQNRLYLESTLKNWYELKQKGLLTAANFPGKNYEQVFSALENGPNSKEWKLVSLDKRCSSTATAWKVEAGIDQAYKWSCDRAFCRTVPAGWTSDKNIEDIEKVVVKQQQCAATGRGVPLTKIEDCRSKIKNPLNIKPELENYIGVCWQTVDGTLYINDESPGADARLQQQGIKRDGEEGVYLLTAVGHQMPDLQPKQPNLLVYKPEGAQDFIVGKDQNCKQVCGNQRKPGYGPDIKYGDPETGCYDERPNEAGTIVLVNPNNHDQLLGTKRGNEEEDKIPRYAAGYTRDCFLKRDNNGNLISDENSGEPILQQCVCRGKKTEESPNKLVRAAVKEDKEASLKEEWSYQQDAVYRESGKRAGTYYPKLRYYTGRDLSGAFGADYILDYIHLKDTDKTEYQVNPHTQLLGTVQTVCLSGILKNMKMLENVLIGLRNCLIEAKYTGLQDAGMCKTLFTQHVCGLIYKGISSLVGGCTPNTFDDVAKETVFGDIGVFFEEGGEAMSKSISTSINDLQDDYGNAKLNEYFKGGVEGFAQSICLGMFGYDIPLFTEDFLLDAAYAFPTKTTPLVAPASRELSTYDPAKQTAIYNYEVGAVVLAGCKIKRWNVKLKCIGPEDRGNPGIDETCDGQQCDCLNINTASAFEGERTYNIPGAAGFNIPSGDLLTVPIESPLRVNSHYRYDHVIVELELDGSEKGNQEACFDKQYVNGNTAAFYFPIADRSMGLVAGCRADVVSGRFSCPELSTILGFGGANLEDPYITCWNERTQSRMPCDTPNLYTYGDIIKTGVHINVDGKGYCLKRTVNGVPGITPQENTRAIPTSVSGPMIIEDTLGSVTQSMFGGASANIIVNDARSNSGCNRGPIRENEAVSIQEGEYTITIIPRGSNQIFLDFPNAITAQGDYDITGNRLRFRADPSRDAFTTEEINKIKFNIGGFVVSNLFDGYDQTVPNDKNVCVYRVTRGSTYQNEESRRIIPVKYELFNTDEQGGCTYLQTRPKSTLGPSMADAKIVIQKQRSLGANLHTAFINNKFDDLQREALRIIELNEGDIENALAVYYLTAGFIKQRGQATNQELTQNVAINNLLNVFFDRTWNQLPQKTYDPNTVVNTEEYKKIRVYLCLIDKSMQSKHQNKCEGVS